MSNDAHPSGQKFEWQPNGKLLLLVLCLFPLLVFLGLWQLDRAVEKQGIVDEFTANQQAAPAGIEALDGDDNLQYRTALLVGALDADRRVILDNRVKLGRPGYEILEVLTIEGFEQKILVNRGWVAASLDRNVLPEVTSVLGQVELRGAMYRTLGGYRLDDGIGVLSEWPARVGWISSDRAAVLFAEEFYPYQLRLDATSPGALTTGWVTVAVQPAKHTGYAVQWFAMAAVLLLMTVIANSNLANWLKSKREN